MDKQWLSYKETSTFFNENLHHKNIKKCRIPNFPGKTRLRGGIGLFFCGGFGKKNHN